ncbi:Transcriptional regulator with XRE-family HTH domain OS=Streptomyces albaduncus OX=68172 GN=FHS32_003147 PE=4 SV=1 [Streptomyces griseoloalbus]
MSTVRETRSGRAAKVKKEEGGGDLPGAWAAYGRLLQHLRKRAGLTQQQLGEAIGYSLEQVASVEQGRRPAKAAFTQAADRVLEAAGFCRCSRTRSTGANSRASSATSR